MLCLCVIQIVSLGSSRRARKGREGGRERCLPVRRHVEAWQRILHTGADQPEHQGSVWKHLLIQTGNTTQTPQEADSELGTRAGQERGGGGGGERECVCVCEREREREREETGGD